MRLIGKEKRLRRRGKKTMSKQEEVLPCTERPCPYMGYTDTKKCWFHSRGLPAPPPKEGTVLYKVGPMTFTEALILEKRKDEQEAYEKRKEAYEQESSDLP